MSNRSRPETRASSYNISVKYIYIKKYVKLTLNFFISYLKKKTCLEDSPRHIRKLQNFALH